MEQKSNKLLLIFIFIITAGLAGAAVWIGWRLSQEKEVTPTPSEAAIIEVICNGNGGSGTCSGSANSGRACNTSCAGIPPAGYMWSCWDLGSGYRCYPQTTNEGGSHCYCFQSPCTDSSNWAECGCDIAGCEARCLVEIGNNTYHEVTWECGDTAGGGCRQFFTCSCTQQQTTTTPATTTTTTPYTTTTTPYTTTTTPYTTTTTPYTTTTTSPPQQTTSTPTTTTTTTTTPITTFTTTPPVTTTPTTVTTATSAPRVGIIDDALSSTRFAIILIIFGIAAFFLNLGTKVFEPLINAVIQWTEKSPILKAEESLREERKKKFEQKFTRDTSKFQKKKVK